MRLMVRSAILLISDLHFINTQHLYTIISKYFLSLSKVIATKYDITADLIFLLKQSYFKFNA